MVEDKDAIEIRGVRPPKSALSTVLNGAGNGLMIVGAPVAAINGAAFIFDKPLPTQFKKAGVFASVAGCLIGAYYGLKESKQLDDYRHALASEIKDLHAKVEGHLQTS
jgi:hypothetical protein